jgi:hypothetical protein
MRRTTKPPSVGGITLSAEELEQIRHKAREEVEKEARKAAVQAALDAAIEEERAKIGLDEAEEYIEININIPEHAATIVLDGQKFYHGHTYRVPKKQALYLAYQMQLAWRHDDEIHGKWFNMQPRSRHAFVDVNGNVVNRAGAFA